MTLPAMPWRVLVVVTVLGGVWGFVRGLDYPPTVVFAVVEGAWLIGIPALLLGLIIVGLWSLAGHSLGRNRS